MSVYSLPLFDDADCPWPLRPIAPTAPRSLDEILADLASIERDADPAEPWAEHWVQLDGPEPATHPDLHAVIEAIRASGARIRMVTADADRLKLAGVEHLRDLGLEQIDLWLLGASPETHDACVGRPGALAALQAMLPDMSRLANLYTRARFVLRRPNVAEVAQAVDMLGTYFHVFDICRVSVVNRQPAILREDGVPRHISLQALRTVWEQAQRFRLPLVVQGFGSWPDPPVPTRDAPPVADDGLHALLTEEVHLPGLVNGTVLAPPMGVEAPLERLLGTAGGDVQEVGLRLAAWGVPARDLPVAMGGLDLSSPDGHDREWIDELIEDGRTDLPAHRGAGPDPKVAVIGGPIHDGLLAMSTFGALYRELKTRGVDVVLHSPYQQPFNPWAPDSLLPDLPMHPAEDGRRLYDPQAIVDAAPTNDRMAYAEVHHERFLDELDLTGRTLVLCPSWRVALRVWAHPTLEPDARVVISDLHMLADHLQGLTQDGWPDERLVVHSTFPRYIRSYWRAGVPMRQILWRPYPLHRGHFGLGPEPATRSTLFAGGNHGRDWRSLQQAVALLGGDTAQRVHIHTGDEVPVPLHNHGVARLLAFHEALANSRYVVVALQPTPWRPSGISVMSMALAAGRPVIATSTRAAHDHLRHGIDSLIVPAKDPRALAAAMKRLDEDDALVAHLARGARQAGAALGVDRWADELLHGREARRVWPLRGDDAWGPYQSWPRG